MFDDFNICPYTGLRSFTEEESIYFKGRDEHIEEATEQLERNKFLMLTGASGDGKSSLVYAGIIPNARAGFLKAKYTQWCVADFRPERTPFKNLSSSIARQLDIENVETVQSELKYGFSALVELYKNSKRYVDKTSAEWLEASDEEKIQMDRDAANLIILVDQFEEFFTNPENYHDGVTSGNSNLVVNLLLETAQIALDDDLPIYVVFTMRSDYIGQCAAFRGLPEYIGFSQFFVPRLNRRQLQQVVEEPAELSGNQISRRLTERLIHDLKEGVDQLPILQHALNLIWHEADSGKEEMDLIHYAKVGGMPADDLPDDQRLIYDQWFGTLSDEIKACYSEPGLQNVLNTHTNKLFKHAATYYKEKTGNEIDPEEVQDIIRATFTCLTKIDESRAVRNRMSLVEITRIAGYQEQEIEKVGQIINLFREPGNTLVRPFISDDPESEKLSPETVLDITHESLIRNWELLGDWAEREYQNYIVSLDFEKQLEKWVNNDKSRGFLLSIGPLTYFENWYEKVNPNKYWIARYLPEELDDTKRYASAGKILHDMREFLERSARKHLITRTVMKYGGKRIAATLALIALFVLMSFSLNDYYKSRNEYLKGVVQDEIYRISNMSTISSENISSVINFQFATNQLELNELLTQIPDDKQKLKVLEAMVKEMAFRGGNLLNKELFEVTNAMDSLLNTIQISSLSNDQSDEYMSLLVEMKHLTSYFNFLNPDGQFLPLVENSARRSAEYVIKILNDEPDDFNNLNHLFLLLEHAVNYNAFTENEIDNLLKVLSPYENADRSEWIKDKTRFELILIRGLQNYGQRFNGLYQQLAYLYATKGDLERVKQCVDTTHKYSQNYYLADPELHVDNYRNIIPVFAASGNAELIKPFLTWYGNEYNLTDYEVYANIINYSQPLIQFFDFLNYFEARGDVFTNINVWTMPDEVLYQLFDELDQKLDQITNVNERYFYKALLNKNRGMSVAIRNGIRAEKEDVIVNQYYDACFNYYNKTNSEYLDEVVPLNSSFADDNFALPRKSIILYPDYRTFKKPYEGRALISFRYSDSFANYLVQREDFNSIYNDEQTLALWERWHLNYSDGVFYEYLTLQQVPDPEIQERIIKKLDQVAPEVNMELIRLTAINWYAQSGEYDKATKLAENVDVSLMSLNIKNAYNGFIRRHYLEKVAESAGAFVMNDRMDLAVKFIGALDRDINQSSTWSFALQKYLLMGGDVEVATSMYDSAVYHNDRIERNQPFSRVQLAIANGFIKGQDGLAESNEMVRNLFPGFNATWALPEAMGYHDNLKAAVDLIPSLSSTAGETVMYLNMLKGYYYEYEYKPKWFRFNHLDVIQRKNWLIYGN